MINISEKEKSDFLNELQETLYLSADKMFELSKIYCRGSYIN